MKLSDMTALELGRRIRAKEIGVVEAAKDALSNIESIDKSYHAFVDVCATRALKQAEEVQKKVKNAVETMTGLNVAVVNVSVSGIVREKSANAEEEE